jgi:UDP-GlcNAc:undecaprenyl-phosphate GlcNAc-1-phosphate transferase
MDWPDLGAKIAIFGFGAFLSWFLNACYIPTAIRLGVVDHPNDRKLHPQPTPTGAGIVIFIATLPAALFGAAIQFFLGAVVVVIGFIDDCRHLPWQPRLIAYLGIGLAAAHVALPQAPWGWQAAAGLWIFVLINAFNFVDNMDGLCTGVAWVIAACLCLVHAKLLGDEYSLRSLPGIVHLLQGYDSAVFSSPHLLLLSVVLAVFLWFNRRPARVFLGDAGSTYLGFFLGVASAPLFITGYEEPTRLSPNWLAPLCMFAVPVYDLVSVAFLRIWHKRGLFLSDKNNLSHRLVNLGLSQAHAVALIWLLAAVSAVGGVELYLLADPLKTIVGIAQLTAWWVGLPLVEYAAHRLAIGRG